MSLMLEAISVAIKILIIIELKYVHITNYIFTFCVNFYTSLNISMVGKRGGDESQPECRKM